MKWPPSWLERLRGAVPDLALREEAAKRAERAVAMGKRLRDSRVAAGLSVMDVERDTRINRVYIDAIEGARFEELPAPVYARGFTRSYARYLGIDAEEAAAAVPSDLPVPDGLRPMPGLRRTAPPVLPSVNLPVVGGIAAAAVVVLALFLLVPRFGGGDGLGPNTTPTSTTTATAAGTSASTATPGGGTATAGATVPPFDEGTAPDFSGVTRDEAQRVLTQIGATPLIVEAADSTPAGLI
ncbi:MAG: helix-turn-helix domain-containing protein, partial [Dehalococcoidia bacterium]